MKKIIIYGSHYGTTKSYAEKLSEMTGIPVTNYEDIKDLSSYDEIIHFGGLYAGGVKGLKNTVKILPENAKLVIVTVGLSDVTNKENTDNIRKSIKHQISQSVLDRATILHLRGGIDYSKLNFTHKTMMSLLYKKAVKMSEEQKTAEVREMIETYNSKVDFVDFSALQQVIDVM